MSTDSATEKTIWTGPKTNGFVVVPDALSRAVDTKVEEIVAAHPQLETSRESLRSDLIAVFHEYGHMDVEIVPQGEGQS